VLHCVIGSQDDIGSRCPDENVSSCSSDREGWEDGIDDHKETDLQELDEMGCNGACISTQSSETSNLGFGGQLCTMHWRQVRKGDRVSFESRQCNST